MARTLRFIPKDTRTTVAPGWCFSQPGRLPAECSWCGKTFEVIEKAGVVWCVVCDEPKPPAPWGGDPSEVEEDGDA